MDSKLRVIQLNVGRREGAQLSLLNDEDIRDHSVLAIQEPTAIQLEDALLTVPMAQIGWVKMTPTENREGRWAFRSMLWVNAALDATQLPVASPDITAAVISLPERQVLVASVYIEPGNNEIREQALAHLREIYHRTQSRTGYRTDTLFIGDFNLHDQLWGGNEISQARQGEADELIDLMGELALTSLLPRGTKTWQDRGQESTIDLALASVELSEDVLRCDIHPTEHGSDHRAIETTFDIQVPTRLVKPRLLLKNAPWNEIRTRVSDTLSRAPLGGTVQEQTDRLMDAVTNAVHSLTPMARPSPYAKRWWTADLTKLRRMHTHWRNRARRDRRANCIDPELEKRAREAAKEYHDAIRKQKQSHWRDFLADSANIWKAARYLKSADHTAFDKIPPLTRTDGSTTRSAGEQAEELIKTFFPPPPERIENEGPRPQRGPTPFPALTLEEIERQIRETKPWKAPGEDGLPAAVWKEVWPATKDRILRLFQQSLDTGELPHQWRQAKIVPLKKPNKGDYTKAKAWRPISLLSTLGKVLEAVVAERISNLVETHGLLPANHFGARKQRSAEQALVLLQEQIYEAWRGKKVLSLVSFDVKGAYNGVHKGRLLKRLGARGIPPKLVAWIDSFCSNRTATLVVNGEASQKQALPQAGLPQGSPLSPILFLFFNADLVQQKIMATGGSLAFVDDYTVWVVGENAAANRPGIEGIISRAMAWERQSGATFEGEKTTILHFTRNSSKKDDSPFTIKGQQVAPQESAKVLGVIMDTQLRFKQHIAHAATKGLRAAMALRRLSYLAPATARQIFTTAVTPIVDYASTVWAHAVPGTCAVIDRVQKAGAQAITGAFRTVATAVAEAEATIKTARERFARRALKLWITIRTLPASHPLVKVNKRPFRRFISPLQKIADTYHNLPTGRMETILPYALAPWEKRIRVDIPADRDEALTQARTCKGVIAATSSSRKNGLVGAGFAVEEKTEYDESAATSYSLTLARDEGHNPYTAEIQAIDLALRHMLRHAPGRDVTIFSSNRSALQAIAQPKQQSGQESLVRIYAAACRFNADNRKIRLVWVPIQGDFQLGQNAKRAVRAATRPDQQPPSTAYLAKSTVLNNAMANLATVRALPENRGRFSKEIDIALPGKHTKKLYDTLSRPEANVLVQLRTGMIRLNSYLARIGAEETDLCPCGLATETTKHFLFTCPQWTQQRTQLYNHTETRRGSLSFFVGGKTTSDPVDWKPNITAVRAAIKFAQATNRLQRN